MRPPENDRTSLEIALGTAAERKARNIARQFETERLLLRASTADDFEDTWEAAVESQTALSEWMPWAHPALTRNSMLAYHQRLSDEWAARQSLDYQLIEKATGQFIGKTAFHHIEWTLPRFEIGYWLRTSRVGEGFCTEAVRGMVAFAQRELEARRIEIRCRVENAASRAVAERCGFALEGIMRNGGWAPSAPNEPQRVGDSCLYAVAA